MTREEIAKTYFGKSVDTLDRWQVQVDLLSQLDPTGLSLLEENLINDATAYAFAKLPIEEQKNILDTYKNEIKMDYGESEGEYGENYNYDKEPDDVKWERYEIASRLNSWYERNVKEKKKSDKYWTERKRAEEYEAQTGLKYGTKRCVKCNVVKSDNYFSGKNAVCDCCLIDEDKRIQESNSTVYLDTPYHIEIGTSAMEEKEHSPERLGEQVNASILPDEKLEEIAQKVGLENRIELLRNQKMLSIFDSLKSEGKECKYLTEYMTSYHPEHSRTSVYLRLKADIGENIDLVNNPADENLYSDAAKELDRLNNIYFHDICSFNNLDGLFENMDRDSMLIIKQKSSWIVDKLNAIIGKANSVIMGDEKHDGKPEMVSEDSPSPNKDKVIPLPQDNDRSQQIKDGEEMLRKLKKEKANTPVKPEKQSPLKDKLIKFDKENKEAV